MSLPHHAFSALRKFLPTPCAAAIRSVATACVTPILFSYKTGHFRSSLARASVDRCGKPSVWYTYPAIEFLKHRDFSNRTVLEFGGGMSTAWWGQRASSVLTFEDDLSWYDRLKITAPTSVDLHYVQCKKQGECADQAEAVLAGKPLFDIIIVDGLCREELMVVAQKYCSADGVIIVDNAEGYDAQNSFMHSSHLRVDFFGYAPGVSLQHCTSFFFSPSCFLFSNRYPIPVIDC